MPSQIRYFVRFLASTGIYQGGDVVALDAREYAAETRRRPQPVLELLYEQHEDLGQDGRVIPESVRRVDAKTPEKGPEKAPEEPAAEEKSPEKDEKGPEKGAPKPKRG
jgi:hypothetical protein